MTSLSTWREGEKEGGGTHPLRREGGDVKKKRAVLRNLLQPDKKEKLHFPELDDEGKSKKTWFGYTREKSGGFSQKKKAGEESSRLEKEGAHL